jgi:hypothetical protein
MPDMVILDLDLKTGSVSSGGVVSEEFTARTDESGRMCALDIKTVDQSHLGQWTCDIVQSTHMSEFGYISLLNN